MANLDSLISRVRVELGDLGKSFVTQFVADGSTNRFRLHYAPLDATTVEVQIRVLEDGITYDITQQSSIEESTGVLILFEEDGETPFVPADGDELTVSGNYYRYFTGVDLTRLINDAFKEHSNNALDSTGRRVTLETLPLNEEYPLSIYATTLALYTLATDAAFDIDIQAPDGVSIPRSERYRQLMDMVQSRHQQYRELCALMGTGLYRMEVFELNRISKTTNRLVPKYLPQEVDDRSWPQRVQLSATSLGNKPTPWPTDAGELTSYQGRSFSTSLDFTGNYSGKSFTARVINQRGSMLVIQRFTLAVDVDGLFTVTDAARTSGSTTITLTTNEAHGFSAGNSVVVTGVDDTVDGIYTISTASGSTLTVIGTATTALSLEDIEGQVETNVEKEYTFTLSLTKDQTLRTAERTYWSLSTVDAFTEESIEIKGGNFFTVRRNTAVL